MSEKYRRTHNFKHTAAEWNHAKHAQDTKPHRGKTYFDDELDGYESTDTTYWDYVDENGNEMDPDEAHEYWAAYDSWAAYEEHEEEDGEGAAEPPAEPLPVVDNTEAGRRQRDELIASAQVKAAERETARQAQIVELQALLEEMCACPECARFTALDDDDLGGLQPGLVRALYSQHRDTHRLPGDDSDNDDSAGMMGDFEVLRSSSFDADELALRRSRRSDGSLKLTLGDLPEDIWTVLFEYIPPLSLVTLSYASQWLRRFAEVEGAWTIAWEMLRLDVHHCKQSRFNESCWLLHVKPLEYWLTRWKALEKIEIAKAEKRKKKAEEKRRVAQLKQEDTDSDSDSLGFSLFDTDDDEFDLFGDGGSNSRNATHFIGVAQLGDPKFPWSMFYSFRMKRIEKALESARAANTPTDYWAKQRAQKSLDPLIESLENHRSIVESYAWAELHHLTKNDFARQYAAAKANVEAGMPHVACGYMEGLSWHDCPSNVRLLLGIGTEKQFDDWKSATRMKSLDSDPEKEVDVLSASVRVVKSRDYRDPAVRLTDVPETPLQRRRRLRTYYWQAQSTKSSVKKLTAVQKQMKAFNAATPKLSEYETVKKRLAEVRAEREVRRQNNMYRFSTGTYHY